jgi:undecaprenyl-diphosphatase
MTIIQSILLGIIQGLTEFLPISSTAHLLATQYLLNWQIPETEAFIFDVLIQIGTLLAVIAFYWRDLWEIIVAVVQGLLAGKPFETSNARLGWLIVIATLPALLAGLLFKSWVEKLFTDPGYAAALRLIITAVLLILAEQFGRLRRSLSSAAWPDALIIGLFQVLAVFPGSSRSGSTISGGMLRGLNRPDAARFAFLMSVPVMLAAGASAALDLRHVPNVSSYLAVLAPGFIAAAVVGYLSIRWLIGYLANHKLYVFAAYTTALAMLIVLVKIVRG